MLRFDGEHFTTAGSSKFSHTLTYGMGNYKGQALTTGCLETNSVVSSNCGVKTEIMDMTTLKWTDGPDYTFGR